MKRYVFAKYKKKNILQLTMSEMKLLNKYVYYLPGRVIMIIRNTLEIFEYILMGNNIKIIP
jgi:hypothetical protein